MRASDGVLTSPNFPSNYGPGLDCDWTIHVGPGRTLDVQITSLNIASDDEQCGQDYLMVSDA